MFWQLNIVMSLLGISLAGEASTFDFIIVGGGPAGLVLANRLSSNPNLQIAVIEAGDSVYNNSNVTDVLGFPGTIALRDINYAYSSAPQKYTADKVIDFNGGKALGGTTTINGMTYLRAEREQIDAWEELGNEGWNWDALWPHFLKQEGFQPPSEELRERGANCEEDAHGFDGEVATGFIQYLTGQGFFSIMKETNENAGIPWNRDANKGRMRGFTSNPQTLNTTESIREDAARAYYYPVASERTNLHVFLNTTALRVVWQESKEEQKYDSGVVASGVEVSTSGNTTETISIKAGGEVILSAGSIRSPALLEHSGVGNPSILSPLDIDTVIDLPGVGANLQDQPNLLFGFNSTTVWEGFPTFVTYVTASDLFSPSDLESLIAEIQANISSWALTIVSDSPEGDTTVSIQEKLLTLQADLVFTPNSTIPLAELIWYPLGPQIMSAHWNLLPFARGHIHINSKDPMQQPVIQPNFFQLDIDVWVQAAASVKLRELFSTSPLKEYVTEAVTPDFSTVPEGAGFRDPSWEAWIKEAYGGNNHPLATCAMMSRELNGVVDSDAKVYGAKNVRVVDASIIPMQVSGHLTSNIYAVAEKISKGILEERA